MDALLIILVTALCLSNSVYSVLAPFFPRISEEHGLSSTQNGIIFSGYPFLALISAPIMGYVMFKIGRKLVLFYSVLMIGVSLIGFASLPLFYGSTLFTIALITRCIQGIGGAGILTSSFAVIAGNY